MNQIKIGKFITECRKNKDMTQAQLAKKLNITDRAISKWETGKGMPDSSIMLKLCAELGISVNELLSGEMISTNNYNQNAEKKLLEFKKIDEKKNQKLFYSSIVIVLLLLSVIIMGLYNFIIQVSKGTLDSTLTHAQSIYEINIKLNELEERINNLEK